METYKINTSIEDFIEANKAVEVDIIEGCLIDNFLLQTDTEVIFLKETYQNCWTSIYTVYRSTDHNEIYGMWEAFERAIKENQEGSTKQ